MNCEHGLRLATQKQLAYLKDLDPDTDYSHTSRLEARRRINELVNGKVSSKLCLTSHAWKRGRPVTDDLIELMCRRCGVIVHSHVQLVDVRVKGKRIKNPLEAFEGMEALPDELERA